MLNLGINWGYLFVQLGFMILWLFLTIVALLQLRSRTIPETARAVWAMIVVVIPQAGAIAFWIVRPGKQQSDS